MAYFTTGAVALRGSNFAAMKLSICIIVVRMDGKREFVAGACSATGLTWLLEHLRKRASLVVLNYHRVGNGDATPYDSGVFSVTAEQFEWQVSYLKRHFEICRLDEALAMVIGEQAMRACVLLTFDDGYRDNYEVAFPILRAAGVSATFFLPTAFIGSNRLPWWDLIAFIVKNAGVDCFRVSYPYALECDISRHGQQCVIVALLRAYKQPEMRDHDRFVAELLASAESKLPAMDSEACFMTWHQAREMREGGMDFGSHTHSHEVLSKLSVENQYEELECSRKILERELSAPITSLAYPVGGKAAFSKDTQEMAKRSGYDAAFFFYGGFNLRGAVEPYDVHRFAVEQQSHPRFRLQMALGGISGAVWV